MQAAEHDTEQAAICPVPPHWPDPESMRTAPFGMELLEELLELVDFVPGL